MKLNMPKVITWWISVALGVIGIVLYLIGTVPVLGFIFLGVGWLLLLLGTTIKGL